MSNDEVNKEDTSVPDSKPKARTPSKPANQKPRTPRRKNRTSTPDIALLSDIQPTPNPQAAYETVGVQTEPRGQTAPVPVPQAITSRSESDSAAPLPSTEHPPKSTTKQNSRFFTTEEFIELYENITDIMDNSAGYTLARFGNWAEGTDYTDIEWLSFFHKEIVTVHNSTMKQKEWQTGQVSHPTILGLARRYVNEHPNQPYPGWHAIVDNACPSPPPLSPNQAREKESLNEQSTGFAPTSPMKKRPREEEIFSESPAKVVEEANVKRLRVERTVPASAIVTTTEQAVEDEDVEENAVEGTIDDREIDEEEIDEEEIDEEEIDEEEIDEEEIDEEEIDKEEIDEEEIVEEDIVDEEIIEEKIIQAYEDISESIENSFEEFQDQKVNMIDLTILSTSSSSEYDSDDEKNKAAVHNSTQLPPNSDEGMVDEEEAYPETYSETQAILNAETQALDLDIPEPEGGFASSEEEDEEDEDFEEQRDQILINQQFQRDLSLLGQDVLQGEEEDAISEELDEDAALKVPEPAGGFTQEPQDSGSDSEALFVRQDSLSFPPSSVEDESASSEDIQSFEDLANPLLAKGYTFDSIIQAIHLTSANRALLEPLLRELKLGRGVPDNERGVWTEEDDADLQGGDARGILRVESKHGRSGPGGCRVRVGFLREEAESQEG
jgi:hypothetical protein